ncbi:hypothetical protein [Variovorax sp. JS1663]|uniref:hypothetical protein n=1 Tax=Variovorax sp. JS1663 TaxID=1851577 RepID=UPI000B348D68|nr:hypothetical protein [Variovorax sp. JS1663]OUM00525.1 hypothetical protein A8M77_20885 [Variovorax sp. JS1663]
MNRTTPQALDDAFDCARAALFSSPADRGAVRHILEVLRTRVDEAASQRTEQQAGAAEPVAWMHQDDPARVISAVQKAQALRDGGASASSVKAYSIPLAHPPAADPVAAAGRLGVAVALLTECLGPLEVSAAIIESEDGGEAIETLIKQVRKFCTDAKLLWRDRGEPDDIVRSSPPAAEPKPIAEPCAEVGCAVLSSMRRKEPLRAHFEAGGKLSDSQEPVDERPGEAEAFEKLCREHDIFGTAAARQCEVFWKAGARFTSGEPVDAETFDALMRESGLEAIATKDYRDSRGQPMTSPEQDQYNAAIYFAHLVLERVGSAHRDEGGAK